MEIEKVRAQNSQFSYTDVMNMKPLELVTPPSIYHGCSTWKTFWEEDFTLGEFPPVNRKKGVCHNVRKHIYIKDIDKYITLDISLKFGSLDKMRIKSSEPKDYLVGSGKGLITSPIIKTDVRSTKTKKARYDITNVSMKDLSIIITKIEKLPYKSYVQKRPKYEYTDSYFYQSRNLAKCMMIDLVEIW